MDGIFLILIILAAIGLMIGNQYPRMLVTMFCDLLLALLKAVISIVVIILPPLANMLARLCGAGIAAASSKIATMNSANPAIQTAPNIFSMSSAPVSAAVSPVVAQAPIQSHAPVPDASQQPSAPQSSKKAQPEKAVNPYSEPPDIDIVS